MLCSYENLGYSYKGVSDTTGGITKLADITGYN